MQIIASTASSGSVFMESTLNPIIVNQFQRIKIDALAKSQIASP
jgi:hypothetical protein